MDLTKLKIAFVTLSSIVFALFVVSVIQNADKDWLAYQDHFYSMEKARGVSRDYSVGIKQIWLEKINRTDRCITCHLGMEDVDVKNPYTENPYKAHPDPDGFISKYHNPNKFGCTVCHDGQGLGTTLPDAHGHVPHWDYPLLDGDYVEASCTRCHDPNNLPKGTEWVQTGHALFIKYGCIGCHSVNGVGGKIGPDLTGEGSKSDARFISTHDFSHVKGEETKREWIFEHFMNPRVVSP